MLCSSFASISCCVMRWLPIVATTVSELAARALSPPNAEVREKMPAAITMVAMGAGRDSCMRPRSFRLRFIRSCLSWPVEDQLTQFYHGGPRLSRRRFAGAVSVLQLNREPFSHAMSDFLFLFNR